MLESNSSVSVIIPCFNAENTLARAVMSVQAQATPVAEILLVDDGSTDNTRAVIGSLAHGDPRIRPLLQKRNGGPSRARNVGWNSAQGDLIAFLDADDTWHPQKIAVQLPLFERDPEIVISGHLCDVGQLGDPYQDVPKSAEHLSELCELISPSSVKVANPWSTPTVMLRKSIERRFDEGHTACEDYLLWAEIILSGAKGVRINLPLARLYKARFGAGGLSGNLWRMEKGELAAYRKLYQARRLNVFEWGGLSAYSLLKHTRRMALRSLASDGKSGA